MAEQRMNVRFSKRQEAALKAMAEALETTQAGVLRIALALLEVSVKEYKAGNQISVTRDGKVVKQIIGLGWRGIDSPTPSEGSER